MGGATSQDVFLEEPVKEIDILEVGEPKLVDVQNNDRVPVQAKLSEEKEIQELTIEPRIQVPLKNTQVFEGRTAKLDCVIIAQPEPEVISYL